MGFEIGRTFHVSRGLLHKRETNSRLRSVYCDEEKVTLGNQVEGEVVMQE